MSYFSYLIFYRLRTEQKQTRLYHKKIEVLQEGPFIQVRLFTYGSNKYLELVKRTKINLQRKYLIVQNIVCVNVTRSKSKDGW